ncbi:MAG: outer membrane protein, partial [Thiohalomonadales bacterium]
MRKVVAVLIVFLSLPLIANGQELARQKGDKSLNFSFNGFAIENYKYGFGGMYWISEKSAITASLNMGSTTGDNKTSNDVSSNSVSRDDDYYGFTLGIVRHFKGIAVVSPYVGGEVGYNYSKSNGDNVNAGGGSSTSSKIERYGIDALLGVEYSVTNNLSLAAEYSFGYHYAESTKSSSLGGA